ncbi:MAG TPA: class II fumarate hydratase [Candidatus Bathyarchaeia archaeon]|nr:class II fumarate hydratase [Candidatus Bathyarchaeia archaeon]
MSTRTETDSLGPIEVPGDVYYGAQTQRAIENFPVSGQRFPRRFVEALGLIKWAAAEENRARGDIEARLADAIAVAAEEVIAGRHDRDFALDVFQTGSGTSTNMNANEVISNRAIELLGGRIGSKTPVHPNDHVNYGQSSNDVIPTATHIAALLGIRDDLLPALGKLERSLAAKAQELAGVAKTGRTHLMDAAPVTLGQEFSGYAAQIERGRKRVAESQARLCELPLGGTAVGTGLNAPEGYARALITRIAGRTRLPIVEAPNHFEAQGARDGCVEASGALRTVAVSLMKIANDLRWLGSGPRAGLAEIQLPALQPGSSIMPGKVNPVIPEMCRQVAAQVMGNDLAVSIGGALGDFELNVMVPLITHNLLQSITILAQACDLLAVRCVDGIVANLEECRSDAERNLQIGAALNPVIGYERAGKIVKQAAESGKSIREVAEAERVLPSEELEHVLDPLRLTRGGVI